jgi:hypothetical protein
MEDRFEVHLLHFLDRLCAPASDCAMNKVGFLLIQRGKLLFKIPSVEINILCSSKPGTSEFPRSSDIEDHDFLVRGQCFFRLVGVKIFFLGGFGIHRRFGSVRWLCGHGEDRRNRRTAEEQRRGERGGREMDPDDFHEPTVARRRRTTIAKVIAMGSHLKVNTPPIRFIQESLASTGGKGTDRGYNAKF